MFEYGERARGSREPPNPVEVRARLVGVSFGCEGFDVSSYYPGLDGIEDPRLRADMVFFETPNGGDAFSTGSIAWAGSLGHNGYDNNVARITGNVLRRFIAPAPL